MLGAVIVALAIGPYAIGSGSETMVMTFDEQSKSAIMVLEKAGYAVAVSETARGHWLVRARNLASSEQSKVEAENPYAAAVDLARRLGITLEEE